MLETPHTPTTKVVKPLFPRELLYLTNKKAQNPQINKNG
jgi:hypothetical protein